MRDVVQFKFSAVIRNDFLL